MSLFTSDLTPAADALAAPEAPTLDAAASLAGRARGLAAADDAADEAWKAHADRIVEHLARSQATLTSDDVWAGGLPPNPAGSSTALGARFVAAARAGLIFRTDTVRRTEQVRSHGSPMTVWRSRVFDEVEAWGEPFPPGGIHRDVCPSCTCHA